MNEKFDNKKIVHFKCLTIIYSFFMVFLLNGRLNAQILPPVYVTDSLEFISSNLPVIVIDTHGETIVDEARIVADMGIIYNGYGQRNYLSDSFNNYNGKIAIELRGSTAQMFPKKQYRFETQDSSGNNLNVSLLSMPRENDWVFYGPIMDRSLIRNVLAYKISNDIGRYASRTKFCELVLNGDYLGLYVLMEKIKRDKYRINIARMDSTDITGDQLTGGYIIKLDKFAGENVGYWLSLKGTSFQYHYPKANEIVLEQMVYIQNFMDEFENVMDSNEYADPQNGYLKYIDLESIVDHFIINEFCKNVDAYRISAYMYKDRDSNGGKLNMGPIWDFNLSFGKAWWPIDEYVTEGWCVDKKDHPEVPFWWVKLGHDSCFAEQVQKRWNELRKGLFQKDIIYSTIDSLLDSLAEARTRNSLVWDPEVNYEEEIQLLKQWINDRFDWVDSNINSLTSIHGPSNPEHIPGTFALEQNYPNPFNPKTIINYELPITNEVDLSIYNLLGQKVANLVSEKQSAGHHTIEWDASGFSSGIYFYKIEVGDPERRTGEFQDVKKMVLIR